jgi:hypothetical protein
MELGLGDPRIDMAASLLVRLRAGDRLDELARDRGTTVAAIRKFFASIGIGREDLDKLRTPRKSPRLKLPDDLTTFIERRGSTIGLRKSKPSRWSDEDMLRCLEDAATMAFPLTAAAYDKLRGDFLVRGPSSESVVLRFGTWARACEIAGVECGRAPRDSYTRSWTNRELLEFVCDYVRSTYFPSFSGYEEWASMTEGAPSAQTLRNRLGPWSEIKTLATQVRAVGRLA